MCSPIGYRYSGKRYTPDGTLLAQGKYRTKIFASDLPPWFVYGDLHGGSGFISAKEVRDLLYRPNYVSCHFLKDDFLFISYSGKIENTISSEGFQWYTGYDYSISGHIIQDFIQAASIYSHIDIGEIQSEIDKKKEWYYVNSK